MESQEYKVFILPPGQEAQRISAGLLRGHDAGGDPFQLVNEETTYATPFYFMEMNRVHITQPNFATPFKLKGGYGWAKKVTNSFSKGAVAERTCCRYLKRPLVQ